MKIRKLEKFAAYIIAMPHKKGHSKKKKIISQKQSVKQTVIVKLGDVARKRAKRSKRRPSKIPSAPSAAESAPINLPVVAYQTGYGSFPLMQTSAPAPDPFPFKKAVEEIAKPSMPRFEDVGVGTEGFVEILDRPTKAETLAELIEPVRQQPDPFRAPPSIASSPRIGDPFKIQSPIQSPSPLPKASPPRLSPPIRMESPEIIRSPSVSSGSSSAILSPLREEEPFLFAAEPPRTIDDFFRPLPIFPGDVGKAAPFDYREQSSPPKAPSAKKPKSVSSRTELIMAEPPAVISMGTPSLLPVKQTKKSLANLYQAKYGKFPPTKMTKTQLLEAIA